MPACSYNRTVRATFSGPPNPVSASARIGVSVVMEIVRPISASSVCVIIDRSGCPHTEPVAPLPARYRKSNPTELATWADIPSNTPGPIRHRSVTDNGQRSRQGIQVHRAVSPPRRPWRSCVVGRGRLHALIMRPVYCVDVGWMLRGRRIFFHRSCGYLFPRPSSKRHQP